MKKVCILQNSLTYGGTDTFVINLCSGLVRDGYLVTVVLSVDETEMLPREEELRATGATIVKTCCLRGIRSKLRHLGLLFKHLRNTKYDIFQTNIDLFNGPQLFVAWLAGVPVRECHSHNSEQSKEVKEGRTIAISCYQALMRWMCWIFSNRRGGCSEEALDFLFGDRWRKDAFSKVIHNGIDLQTYEKNVDIQGKKSELGLTNKFNICTVGRIDHQKNPLFIVKVMKEVTRIRDDCDLIWIGTGELKESVQREIKREHIGDRIHLLGTRADVPDILKCCDLFFFPSLFEGLGIVLIEAQAAGLNCIVSEAIPPVANCGGCTFISLTESAEFWAEKISDALDGRLSCTIEAKQLTVFDINYMVQEMEALLKE